MAIGDSVLSQVDAQLDQLFAGWNIYSTVITLLLVAFVAHFLFSRQDPDTHPLLLARQSSASHVRQPGESATYRSLESPHGYPLRSGLGVKDPGAPKWTSGRDGDLRDVWKQALKGVHGPDGQPTGEKGKVLKVLGREGVIEHQFDDLTRDINIIGQHLRQHGGGRVAIYLPNSVEFLVTFFGTIKPTTAVNMLADRCHSRCLLWFDGYSDPARTITGGSVRLSTRDQRRYPSCSSRHSSAKRADESVLGSQTDHLGRRRVKSAHGLERASGLRPR